MFSFCPRGNLTPRIIFFNVANVRLVIENNAYLVEFTLTCARRINCYLSMSTFYYKERNPVIYFTHTMLTFGLFFAK